MGDRVHTLQCTLRGNSLFFIHLFLVSHAYGHSLSMLSIGLGCMAGVPLVGRSQVILLLSRSSPRILALCGVWCGIDTHTDTSPLMVWCGYIQPIW